MNRPTRRCSGKSLPSVLGCSLSSVKASWRHPERGRGPRRFLQPRKPESKNLGFDSVVPNGTRVRDWTYPALRAGLDSSAPTALLLYRPKDPFFKETAGPSASQTPLSLRMTTILSAAASSPHVTRVGADHLLSFLAAPRFLELRHVLVRSDHAPSSGRVRIDNHAAARVFRRSVLTPHLRLS